MYGQQYGNGNASRSAVPFKYIHPSSPTPYDRMVDEANARSVSALLRGYCFAFCIISFFLFVLLALNAVSTFDSYVFRCFKLAN